MALQQNRCELEELGCGGCALLSLPYEKQLQKKQKELKALLGKYRKLHPILGMELPYEKQLQKKQKELKALLGKYRKLHPILGMEEPWHYRNKVISTFTYHEKKLDSGIYIQGTHKVLPVKSCLLHQSALDEAVEAVRQAARACKYKPYDEDRHTGLLRHVLVRHSLRTDEVMVVLVTASPVLPGAKNFVREVRRRCPQVSTIVQNINPRDTSAVLGYKEKILCGKGYIEDSLKNFVREVRRRCPQVSTIVQNINPRDTSAVLGYKEKILCGKGYIEDSLCGVRFQIAASSFYQVNPKQTEVLYQTAISAAKLDGTQSVLDAYCGVGTIGLTAAGKAKIYQVNPKQTEVLYQTAISAAKLDGTQSVLDAYCGVGTIGLTAAGKAKSVLGVELNKKAVQCAIENAKKNGIKNARFLCEDATKFIQKMADKGEHVDVVFMDPPRAGSTPEFLDALCRMKPDSIVYISCNPETLKRDLEILVKREWKVDMIQGVDDLEILVKREWKVDMIQGVDLFPGTKHTEVVCCLTHHTPHTPSI